MYRSLHSTCQLTPALTRAVSYSFSEIHLQYFRSQEITTVLFLAGNFGINNAERKKQLFDSSRFIISAITMRLYILPIAQPAEKQLHLHI